VVEEQAEDDKEGGGLAQVIQEVAEDSRSRFENFKPKSLTNLTKDTDGGEVNGGYEL
jgi:hypothetical protein